MEKEAYLKHREAARPIKDAYLNLLAAIRNAPDDTCIRVRIIRKGGEWKDISVEYLAVTPFIRAISDYDRICREEAGMEPANCDDFPEYPVDVDV